MTDAGAPPPFVDSGTERLVLGASLEFDGVAAQFNDAGVRESHFYSHHHRVIWRRLVEALRHELGACQPTVFMLLVQHREMDDVRPAYLSELVNGVPRPNAASVRALAGRLVECAVGRQTLTVLQKAQSELAQTSTALTDGFFSRLDTSFRSLSTQLRGRRVPDHLSHISEVMSEVRAALAAGPPEFVDTPWPALNSMLGGGFAPGELVYFGARPGLGKTAGALEIARRTAKRGAPVLVISREMLKIAIGLRMVAQEGPINATWLRKRGDALTPGHWRTIDLAIEQLQALPIFLTHAPLTIEELRQLVGIVTDEAPLGLLVIDYLQLLGGPPGVGDRRLQVEAISAGVKALTLDYEMPVLCLSSLSRPPENRRPTLASLRESGNLEHDADTVILLHRQNEMDPQTEVIVCKSRNGRTGLMELYFRGEYQRFEETAGAHAE